MCRSANGIRNQNWQLAYFHIGISKLLHIAQFTVVAILFEQLVVMSTFYNLAFVHHTYFVRILYCRKAVSDNQRGAVLHQVVECILHQTFRFGIESRCGFVKNQYLRVL